MAKSLRSKWRRKMRQVKRERYGKKELDRLKKTLGIEDTQGDKISSNIDANMTELSEVMSFNPADKIRENQQKSKAVDVIDQATIENIKKFNSKTLMNENGAYPVWVHPRKIRKCKKSKDTHKIKKSKSKVTKKASKK